MEKKLEFRHFKKSLNLVLGDDLNFQSNFEIGLSALMPIVQIN